MTPAEIEQLGLLTGKLHYRGNLSDYQLNGNSFKGSRYHKVNASLELSPYQNKLYLVALYGFSVLTPEEINKMPYFEKVRVEKRTKHAQNVLNWYKQQVANQLLNSFFDCFFPNSEITKEIKKEIYNKPDPSYKSKFNFKSLRITKLDIINLFITNKVLPENFMTIKEEEVSNMKYLRTI